MQTAGVRRSFSSSYITYECHCGWVGDNSDIEEWDIQRDRDRAVRICPACGTPMPEWGTHTPIEGVAKVARGPLHEALENVER
ncbi:hypothetical protein GCM10008985_34750 [Halococcus dombrowskii]|uniref:Small CPxCG-related zinc finger protein n=1 Tax=Halococcus dombrowskii TaxID=179637 RepID=A0AAV3SLU6_HALDO